MRKTRVTHTMALCASALAFAQSLYANTEDLHPSPAPEPGILTGAARHQATLLRSDDPGAERFLPVGKLLTGSGDYHCTASVIAGTATPPPDRPALILAAGHCVNDTMHDNEVVIDQPAGSNWSFTPSYFVDTAAQHMPIAVSRTVYATMKGADLAVLQLNATYGQLAASGVHPLRLEQVPATKGTPIELVHIPVIGVPQQERFLRHSSCRTETAAMRLMEGFGPWLWSAAVANDCQGVAGGTSGSPVFRLGGNTVIGVLNTTVSPEYSGCGLGRPCELTESGPHSREGSSYAMSIDGLVQALRDDGTLDTATLDPGDGVRLERVNLNWITRRDETVDGTTYPARWNLRAGEGFDAILYKVGQASAIDCADMAGYQGPFPARDQPLAALQTPAAEGLYVVCVVGQASGSGTWQPYPFATLRLRQIDETPPTITPDIVEFRSEDGRVLEVFPNFRPYELVDLFVKYGAAAQTDCQDPDGYARHIRNRRYTVDDKQPWRICSYGVDAADNAGPVASRDYNPAR